MVQENVTIGYRKYLDKYFHILKKNIVKTIIKQSKKPHMPNKVVSHKPMQQLQYYYEYKGKAECVNEYLQWECRSETG